MVSRPTAETPRYLKYATMAPKHDRRPSRRSWPRPTSKMGVVATMSTTFYPAVPARPPGLHPRQHRGGTVRLEHRHLRRGRLRAELSAGTSSPNTTCATTSPTSTSTSCAALGLLGTGRGDPRPRDQHVRDFKKVHAIHFAGKYFKSRGPMNTVCSPQGRPVFVQAGGSPRGRQFASKSADSDHRVANGVEGMKAYRDDVRARAAAQGRIRTTSRCCSS